MENFKLKYDRWINSLTIDEDTRSELQSISGDMKEIEERFYKSLEFGTGGLRGIIGAGTNRINRYTIRKATVGLAKYIIDQGDSFKNNGVVIAYDSRHFSKDFADEAALTLAHEGIPAYVFEELRPTPELSFAVRNLRAAAGIVITASHNPPEYNGYKVYGPDGGQIPPETADIIISYINAIEDETSLPVLDKDEAMELNLYRPIGQEIDELYNEQLIKLSLNADRIQQMGGDFHVVYTPLHGTGNMPVKKILSSIGFKNVHIVREQELPDPNFSTVKSPNPEEKEAFTLAIQLANDCNADLIIGTDPDTDRVGLVAKNNDGEYETLNGNQTGVLMLDYILSQRKEKQLLPNNGIVLKTIVTSDMGRVVAQHYGVQTEDTLTGFKFIGEKIAEYEQTQAKTFLFGYEESYGYLVGDFVRDKDAVQACLIAAEMSAYYKTQGLSLFEKLDQLYEKHGYYIEDLVSLTKKGKDGVQEIEALMSRFRAQTPNTIGGLQINIVEDYFKQERKHNNSSEVESIELPISNVLKYILEDGSWFCLRPSGTEPKIKIYFSVKSSSKQQSQQKLDNIKREVLALL